MAKIITLLSLYLSICFTYHIEAQTVENQFQKILDTVFKKNPDAIGIALHVVSPNRNISWSGVAGLSEKGTTQELKKNHPVLIASNTKTYVAAAILRLVELDKLKLHQPLQDVLSNDTCEQLKVTGYDIQEITITHLLSHTSGIVDYVDAIYFDFVNANKQYQWTRNQQIALAITKAETKKNPGTAYTYADVNYVLLTEIIEQITQQPFYMAMRELLKMDELGLSATWFVTLEEKTNDIPDVAHQYWEKQQWDSSTINPSWDLYGGGGLAATVKDMALFYQLLFSGSIITNEKLIKLMYTSPFSDLASNYCLGVQKIDFHGSEAYYHGGFWGTDVMYIPELHTTIAAYVLQKESRVINATVSKEFIDVLKNR